jgi:hypothetical protein
MIARWEQGRATVDSLISAGRLERKALASILANQGLRPTSSGGHIAVYEAVLAQFDPPLGDVFKPFGWMRPLRNDSEYPSLDRPVANGKDAIAGRAAAAPMVERAEKVLNLMPVYGR